MGCRFKRMLLTQNDLLICRDNDIKARIIGSIKSNAVVFQKMVMNDVIQFVLIVFTEYFRLVERLDLFERL